jgi:hypothetical protein
LATPIGIDGEKAKGRKVARLIEEASLGVG